jgi:GNAT superfamily N-acetyltransferase
MIRYGDGELLDVADVVRVFETSGINRPTDAPERIARMFAASNVVLSAWSGKQLVGVCRALTDFSYCCYLSDLAVDKAFQGQGIGTQLVAALRGKLGEEVSIVLLSAPGAMSWYPETGFSALDNAFTIRRSR